LAETQRISPQQHPHLRKVSVSESNVLLDEEVLTDPKIQALLLTVLVSLLSVYFCVSLSDVLSSSKEMFLVVLYEFTWIKIRMHCATLFFCCFSSDFLRITFINPLKKPT